MSDTTISLPDMDAAAPINDAWDSTYLCRSDTIELFPGLVTVRFCGRGGRNPTGTFEGYPLDDRLNYALMTIAIALRRAGLRGHQDVLNIRVSCRESTQCEGVADVAQAWFQDAQPVWDWIIDERLVFPAPDIMVTVEAVRRN